MSEMHFIQEEGGTMALEEETRRNYPDYIDGVESNQNMMIRMIRMWISIPNRDYVLKKNKSNHVDNHDR